MYFCMMMAESIHFNMRNIITMISDEHLDLTSEVKDYGREFSVAFLLGFDNSNHNAPINY